MNFFEKPIFEVFFEYASNCQNKIILVSNRIEKEVVVKLYEIIKKNVSVVVYTHLGIENSYNVKVDPIGLMELLNQGANIYEANFDNVTLCIFDEKCLILNNGCLCDYDMHTHIPGTIIVYNNKAQVEAIGGSIIKSENTQEYSKIDCNLLIEYLKHFYERTIVNDPSLSIRKYKDNNNKKPDIRSPHNNQRIVSNEHQLLSGLDGWNYEVMKIIIEINSTYFYLRDVYLYESRLKQLFPDNHTVFSSIRRTLQTLRDQGLIIFDRRGEYKKNWIKKI